jgi:hypothetical protein
MPTLLEDLHLSKRSLQEFHDLTFRALNHMPNVISETIESRGYKLCTSQAAGTSKNVRPIRNELFLSDPGEFTAQYGLFMDLLQQLGEGNCDNINDDSYSLIDKVAYTIQQSVGIGLDLLDNPNSARKHVGNRFEELLRLIITGLGISNRKIVFNIPYKTDEGEKLYKCETDMIISPYEEVLSDTQSVHPDEIVISSKTTSKDRMGKIFTDKLLLQRFTGNDAIRVVGIFQNDVQRATRKNGTQTISYTLVAGLFMVYTQFLTQMEGVYFVDPPPNAFKSPWKNHIFPFSKFVIDDIWTMIEPKD